MDVEQSRASLLKRIEAHKSRDSVKPVSIFFGRRSDGHSVFSCVDHLNSCHCEQTSYLNLSNDELLETVAYEDFGNSLRTEGSDHDTIRYNYSLINWHPCGVDLLLKLHIEVDQLMQNYIESFLNGLEHEGYATREGIKGLLFRLNTRHAIKTVPHWYVSKQQKD